MRNKSNYMMLSEYNSNNKSDSFSTISVWIIEDNTLYRKNMIALINEDKGMKCTGDFESCEEALERLQPHLSHLYPKVVLLDIGLPGMSGIEGITKIKSLSPRTEIIMITVHDDNENIFQAICSGANGYLLKTAPEKSIIKAIRDIVAGGSPMNSAIARKIVNAFSRRSIANNDLGLTHRENEILHLLVDGLMIKQIADKLFLSYNTIETHLRSIYSKLRVHSRAEAVSKALKNHLI